MPYVKMAIDALLERNVEKIVHCGDYVAPFIKKAMDVAQIHEKCIEFIGVLGNNDGMSAGLMTRLFGDAFTIKGDYLEIEWSGIKISIYHGTDIKLLNNAIDSQKFDLVLTGHTHNIRLEKKGKTLIVNPGETCGYLTGNGTCAVIDLEKKPLGIESVEIIQFASGKAWMD